MTTPTVGIDLGTTCSAIGWVAGGRPRLVEFEGDPLLPSVVHFPAEGTPFAGRAAVNRMALEPERSVRSAKRHMGTEKRWILEGGAVAAHGVATRVLGALLDGAEAELGARPNKAVITVPALFSNSARADTRRAAEDAGLEVARLINEPTAAALAHAHGRELRRRALVFDLGGGTFDASLVDQDGHLVEVRASRGDTRLGGDDLDVALLTLLLERLRADEPELHRAVRSSEPARVRLLEALREAKHSLSEQLEATVRVPFLLEHGGKAQHYEGRLGRTEVEEAAAPLIERCLRCVEQVLEDGGCKPDQVEELLLVGGSTRVPMVWHALHDRFGWEGQAPIEPDRAVALGAAIQAAMIDGGQVDSLLIDVAPHPISVVAVSDGGRCFSCRVVTPANAPLPARHTERFFTHHPFQQAVHIPVVQGAHANPLRNVVLGEIRIDGLPQAPSGSEQRPIAVELRHDLDGMVSIRVTDELSGRTVDGRVVSGGDEAADVREDILEEMAELGMIPGDGSDPDPWLEHISRDEDPPSAEGEPPASTGPDLDEARAAFEAVARRGSELAREHPEAALELQHLAISGAKALEEGDPELALRLYDELADGLFERGIFL
jgi:molecular chaperone DnaK